MLIFERLRSYGLQLKSTKCHLFQSSVPFLGHVVGRDGLQCDPRKIEDVKSWPVPDCLKSVRQFLGYYRRFIPNFANLAEPLVALTGKDVPFVWRPACVVSFTTKREMLAVVSMCIQFRSYLRGARFTLRTDHKSLVWLHRFKDTEGMMARWLHTLHQFLFTIVH